MCFSKVVVKYVSIWVEKSHSGMEMRLIPQQCINLQANTVFLRNPVGLETGFCIFHRHLIWPVYVSPFPVRQKGIPRGVNREFYLPSGCTTILVASWQSGDICVYRSSAKPQSGNAGSTVNFMGNKKSSSSGLSPNSLKVVQTYTGDQKGRGGRKTALKLILLKSGVKMIPDLPLFSLLKHILERGCCISSLI